MKKHVAFFIAALALLVGIAVPKRIQGEGQHAMLHNYKLVVPPTLGGSQNYITIPDDNYAPILNDHGTIAGWGDTTTPDPFPRDPASAPG